MYNNFELLFPRLVSAVVLYAIPALHGAVLPRLAVSENRRFLVTENGEPFFWLGDTCLMLFEHGARTKTEHQPSIDTYFAHRAANGFNVIQATFFFFPEKSGLYDGSFWAKADWLIDRAAHHGLYLALLPVWNVNLPENHPLVEDPWKAYSYGLFLGKRYGDRAHIIWVMGGDPWRKGADVDNPRRLALNRAIAEGIADGANGIDTFDHRASWSSTLMTYKLKAQWYNPRDGSWKAIGDFAGAGARQFTPPSDKDWVLVLDRSD